VNSVYIILCLIAVVVASLFIVSSISRKSGRSEAINDVLEEEAKDRESFDKATRRPLAVGRDLVRRMRSWSEN